MTTPSDSADQPTADEPTADAAAPTAANSASSVATAQSTAPRPGQAGGFSLDVERQTIPGAFSAYTTRLRSGDPGTLPSVLGILLLGLIFSRVSSRFLSLNNIGNLPGQGAYIAIIALGLVFVLLLGEIDLSAGTAGGMAAGFAAQAIFSGNLHKAIPSLLFWSLLGGMVAMVLLAIWLKAYSAAVVVGIGIVLLGTGLTKHVIFALIFAICLGAAVGVFIGWAVAKIGIPSFIVTLALFLAFQGVLLFALNSQPIGSNRYSFWYGLTHDNMSPFWSWVYSIVLVGGYFLYTLQRAIRAKARGLAGDAISLVVARAGALAVIAFVITYYANHNRNTNAFKKIEGLPWALTIPITLMVFCTIALTKTTWGRHLFATGGNAEAARRAGIDVVHIKVTAFTLCSAFGALGGIFLASYTGGAQLDLGAGNILLFAVAAAVIGGTSLFGGRGKPRDAIIGALVIVIIPNGLGLKASLPPQNQQIITGAVLLVAAGVDALSRRRGGAR